MTYYADQPAPSQAPQEPEESAERRDARRAVEAAVQQTNEAKADVTRLCVLLLGAVAIAMLVATVLGYEAWDDIGWSVTFAIVGVGGWACAGLEMYCLPPRIVGWARTRRALMEAVALTGLCFVLWYAIVALDMWGL